MTSCCVWGQVPDPVADFTATRWNHCGTNNEGPTTVFLTWTPITNATGYIIEHGSDVNPGVFTTIATLPATANSYLHTGADSDTANFIELNCYHIFATNSSGLSDEAGLCICLPDSAAPTGLTATVSNGAVVLNWNTTTNVTGYNIIRRESGGCYFPATNGFMADEFYGNTSTFTDTNIVSGHTYIYRVAGHDECPGITLMSAEASASP